jgi:D-glycero-alpha-D-manno-heptose-7-phosphate kinase
MIISSTPYRISFFGGGTDYPNWYELHGGSVLSTTINRYCNIQARVLPPFFRHKYRIVWSKIETPTESGHIDHPAVRAAIEHLAIEQGLEIHHFGDLPARSGLGSSSSFTVGILNALHGLLGSLRSKHQLAEEAIYIEHEMIRENVGVQDQIAAAYGGFNRIDIGSSGEFRVEPLPIASERLALLEDHLVLVFTGVSRTASDVAEKKIAALTAKEDVLYQMAAMVDPAVDLLMSDQDIRQFGEMLHESWQLKRSITPEISTDLVDGIYHQARTAGAIGGKLLGAGGGGFMLLFVEPEKRARVLQVLDGFLAVPFGFENNGTHIALYKQGMYPVSQGTV